MLARLQAGLLFKPLRLAIVSVVLFYISVHYAVKWNRQNPNSHFFDPTEETYAPVYSGPRTQLARNFIAEQNEALVQGVSPRNDAIVSSLPHLAVVFASVKRKTEQYLDAALGSFLLELTEEQRDNMFIAVSIGDPNPLEHPFFEKPWLHGLVDQVGVRTAGKVPNLGLTDTARSKAKLAQIKVTHVPSVDLQKRPLKTTAWHRKATLDYTFALTTCQEIKARHCLIVEDDVVFAENWYNRVEKLLPKADLTASPNKWGYVRLFWAEKYFGWESEDVRGIVLFCIALLVIVSTLLYTFCRAPLRQFRDKEKDRDYQHLSGTLRYEGKRSRLPLTSILIIDAFLLAQTILFILSGRNHVYQVPKGISKMPDRGCCTQAIIYPLELVEGLAQHLITHSGERPYDIMTNRWMESQHREKLAIHPPVLQHIGEGSSRLMSEQYYRRTPLWSFAFEKMQPYKP